MDMTSNPHLNKLPGWFIWWYSWLACHTLRNTSIWPPLEVSLKVSFPENSGLHGCGRFNTVKHQGFLAQWFPRCLSEPPVGPLKQCTCPDHTSEPTDSHCLGDMGMWIFNEHHKLFRTEVCLINQLTWNTILMGLVFLKAMLIHVGENCSLG